MEERGFSELSVDSITSAANTTAPASWKASIARTWSAIERFERASYTSARALA